jgi:farnesyl-diphosphate farnesyltransferase
MNRSEKDVLKGVSRSFYLSLRLLPKPMRRAASLGYLLARTTDTLADSAGVPTASRLHYLDQLVDTVCNAGRPPRWPVALLNSIPDSRERHLLESTGDILESLARLPVDEFALVREVLEIIASGQRLDLSRFAEASGERPATLEDDAALEDYAWRVAGCVGAFWTKLGFLTMGERFSKAPEPVLLEQGIAFGKALQLVNILRDVVTDLADGRCYLPVADPRDTREILVCHGRWLAITDGWLANGEAYAKTLGSRRLRAATILPAMLARETLTSLEGADWNALSRKIKISRGQVYQAVLRAYFRQS